MRCVGYGGDGYVGFFSGLLAVVVLVAAGLFRWAGGGLVVAVFAYIIFWMP